MRSINRLVYTSVFLLAVAARPAAADPAITVATGQETVDFGDVSLGYESEVKSIGLRASVAVAITDITSSDPAFVVDHSKTIKLLKAGETTSFFLSFKPLAAGMKTATITIALAGDLGAPTTVTVTATGNTVMGVRTPGRVPNGCRIGGWDQCRAGVTALGALLAALMLRRPRRGARSNANSEERNSRSGAP